MTWSRWPAPAERAFLATVAPPCTFDHGLALDEGAGGLSPQTWWLRPGEIEEEVVRPHRDGFTGSSKGATLGLVISADLIPAELAAYIGDFRDSEFAWEVTEASPLVFSVPFPSAELLRVCLHDFIRCPINKFMISVHAAAAEPDPVPPLEKVWVLVFGLLRGGSVAPRAGKLTHILKAISEPARTIITDCILEDDGPARLRSFARIPLRSMACPWSSTLAPRACAHLRARVRPGGLWCGLIDPEPGDGGLDDEQGSLEEGSSSEGDDAFGGPPPNTSDGRRNPATSAAGPSGPA
ncbi:hypothetical protein ZWY2020_058258 [Hordeum vulgare]|nr:hypothetical protein ZWY2020_058258 [Hordeum vulgare]